MKYRSITFLTLTALSLGFVVVSASASAQSSQFFALDSDEIIATSEKMLLRHHLLRGHLVITFVHGEQLEFNLPPLGQAKLSLPAPVLDFHAGGPHYGNSGDYRMKGGCSAQAATLQSAIAGVQSACGDNPGSSTCGAAIQFYNEASADYINCINATFDIK